MIVAKLRFNGFEKTVRLVYLLPDIHVVVALPVKYEPDPMKLSTSPVMVFEWKKQIGKYTHEYQLKEIKS